jgi:FixJ family two-component response regulator
MSGMRRSRANTAQENTAQKNTAPGKYNPRRGFRIMVQAAPSKPQIYIVDDDPAIRQLLSMIFSEAGYEVTCFAEGASFLASARAATPACIILDVNIPGQSGLDILKQLNAQDYPAPIFVISGQGDIPTAVEAIRNGALDFIEKPFRGQEVVTRVRESIEAWTRRQQSGLAASAPAVGFPSREPLTARECDVLAQIVAGASSKEAGRQLGISPRTIEFHRARIIEKVGAKNTADLIRIVMTRHSPTDSPSFDFGSSI